MKKLLKITGFSFLGLITLLILAMVLVPVLFKDDIKKAVDKTIQDYVNAKVGYKGLDLSLFSDFPNAQVSIEDVSILNNEPFAGDTLVSVQDLKVSLDVMSMLSSDFQINSIYLDEPRVFARVNKDGIANWDIAVPDTLSDTTTTAEPSSFALNIDKWEIINGHVEYEDETAAMRAVVRKLNHEGSGKIADILEIFTTTKAEQVYFSMADVTYLNNVTLDATTNLLIDGDKYSFKENAVKLNDFGLHFDGFIELGSDVINTDLKIDANESNFKQLLSLIPSVFLEGYENVEANGDFKFDAKIKGPYVGETIPNFDINFLVKDGDFKYPDLGKKVTDINLDINVKNVSNNLDATVINAKSLNLAMGNSKLSGRLLWAGLFDYYVDTDLKLDVLLDEIKDYYPIEGNDLKGKMHLEAKGKGMMDFEAGTFPAVNGFVNFKDGYVKTDAFDLPIEQLNFNSDFSSNGSTKGSSVNVNNLSLLLDGDRFAGDLSISDFDALNYKADVNGKLDLGKLFSIFPLDGMEISKGILDIHQFKTEGNMEAIDNEDYESLTTSGSATLTNFLYTDNDYVKDGFAITETSVEFTPEKIMINSFNGFMGKNDMSINGYLNNYMGYLFSETDTVLGGQMTLNSKKFDVNPFLGEDTEASTEEVAVETAPTAVTPVPQNLHFVFNSTMGELIYDDLILKDFVGGLEIVNGTVKMNQIVFNTLGADFVTSGSYDTRDLNHPKYSFDLDIKKMSIKEAYTYFNVVKELAPLGDKIDGTFNTNMSMNGELLPDYMPDMKTLTMSGILDVIKATTKVSDVKALKGITESTKLSGIKEFVIENEKLDVKVADGKLWIKEFLMNAGDSKLTTQLNTGIVDNTVQHVMALDVPSNMVKSGLSSFGLDDNLVGDRITFNFDVLGTRTDPKVKLKKASSDGLKGAVQDEVDQKIDDAKDEAKQRADEAKEQARKEAEAELARQKDEADAALQREKDRLKAEADRKAQEAKDKAQKDVKDKLGIPW